MPRGHSANNEWNTRPRVGLTSSDATQQHHVSNSPKVRVTESHAIIQGRDRDATAEVGLTLWKSWNRRREAWAVQPDPPTGAVVGPLSRY